MFCSNDFSYESQIEVMFEQCTLHNDICKGAAFVDIILLFSL